MRYSFSLGDIPSKHVPKLANILQFRPKENHQAQEQRIKAAIKTLPSKLKGPGRLIRLIFHPRIDSCDWHKGLNRCVTDVILHHIQIEVGIRLNSLVSHSELLTEEQIDRVSRLRDLHALWLEPETFEKTFLIPSHSIPWSYQTSKCDACILSCIAGNMQTLLDLRCLVRSRATSRHVAKHGNPRLQIWIDAWINSMVAHVSNVTGQPVQTESQLEKNEEQAIAFKRLRSKIRASKKKNYQDAGPHRQPVYNDLAQPAQPAQAFEVDDGIVEDNGEEIVPTKQSRRTAMGNLDEDGADVVLATVDAYTALMSGNHVPSKQVPRTQNGRPYIYHEPESRGTAQTALHDDQRGCTEQNAQAEEAYVTPRQNWKKQAPAHASPTARPPYRPMPASRRRSWESVIFDSNFAESGISNQTAFAYRPPLSQQQRSAQQASSRYASEQPQFASQPDTWCGKAQRSPADEYIDILPKFSNEGEEENSRSNGKAKITRPASVSTVKSSRPVSSISGKHHSSDSSPKTLPPRHRMPQNARGKDNGNEYKYPAKSTQDFLRMYDDIAHDFGGTDSSNTGKYSSHNQLASTLGISQESRAAMFPEGLNTPKRYDSDVFPREKGSDASGRNKRASHHSKPEPSSSSHKQQGGGGGENRARKAQGKAHTRESTPTSTAKDHRPNNSTRTRHHPDEHEPTRYEGNPRLSDLTSIANDFATKLHKNGDPILQQQHRRSSRVKSVNLNGDESQPQSRESNSTRRREERARDSRPASMATTGKANTESNATTWLAGYGDLLRQKDDNSWFYGAQDRTRR